VGVQKRALSRREWTFAEKLNKKQGSSPEELGGGENRSPKKEETSNDHDRLDCSYRNVRQLLSEKDPNSSVLKNGSTS